MDRDFNIVYRLNGEDEIVYVNAEWAKFALSNDASDLLPERVLNRPLWDFVSDETTVHLYRQLLQLARAGQPARFNFRCDSPECRRLMEMTVSGLIGGEVQFETRVLREDERTRQGLLDRYSPRASKMLRICGWCKRMNLDGESWGEIEEAVTSLRLFEYHALPMLTHGMCEACFRDIAGKLADWRSRS